MNQHGQPSPQPSQPTKITELGGFEVVAKIGQGGMGAVYKARQKSLDRFVALKVLPPRLAQNAIFIDRFLREARASAKLNHPNIVQGIDVGQDKGLYYFAMEYIEGRSLREVLKQRGVLAEREAALIIRQIAMALDCAQQVGLVHRDVKPDNILLGKDGTAKLADLGLAKAVGEDSSLTQTGTSVGTPYYISPEQAKGEKDVDIRSDLYSLGATWFHLVTGRVMYEGETSAIIMVKHLNEPAPKAHKINPQIGEGTGRLIDRLLRKNREQRIQTPRQLVEQIDAWLAGGSVATTGPQAPVSGRRRAVSVAAARNAEDKKSGAPWPLIAGVGGGVAVLAAILIAVFSGGGEKEKKKRAVANAEAKTEQTTTTPPVPVEPPAKPTVKKEVSPPAESVETMLKYVKEWERKNPEAYADLVERYRKVINAAEGTAWEFRIRDEAEAALAGVRERWDAAAEKAWQELLKPANAAARSGNYDEALERLALMPKEFAERLNEKAEEQAVAWRKEAEEKLDAVLAEAEKASAELEPEKGLAALKPVETYKYAARADALAALRAKLTHETENVTDLRQKRALKAAEEKLKEYWGRYDAAIFGRDLAAAQQTATQAAGDANLAVVSEQVKEMKELLEALKSLKEKRSAGLAAAKGKSVEWKMGAQKGLGPVVDVNIERGVVYVLAKMAGGEARVPIKIQEIPEAERKELFPEVVPSTPAEWVADGVEKMQGTEQERDLAAAEELLLKAENFASADRYLERVRIWRMGETEVAAEKAWATIEKMAAEAKQPGKTFGEALDKLLTDFKDQKHLATKFGQTKEPRWSQLKEWAEDLVVGFSINKLFKGKVESFNSETREITLSYDFQNPAEAEDWVGECSDYTAAEISVKAWSGPANVRAGGGRLTGTGLHGAFGVFHAAEFAGDIEFSLTGPGHFGSHGGPGVVYFKSRDAASLRFYTVRFRTRPSKDKALEANLSHGSGYQIDSTNAPFSTTKETVAHQLKFIGTTLSYFIDGKPLFDRWSAAQPRTPVLSERPKMHAFVLFSAYSSAKYCEHVRLRGVLRKEWLDEQIRRFKATSGGKPDARLSDGKALEGAPTLADVQKLFKGQVESFDPQSGRIALVYDFKGPTGKGTFSQSELREDWAVPVRVYTPLSVRGHKALFSGDMEFSFSEFLSEDSHLSANHGGLAWQKNDGNWGGVKMGLLADKEKKTFTQIDYLGCVTQKEPFVGTLGAGFGTHTMKMIGEREVVYYVNDVERQRYRFGQPPQPAGLRPFLRPNREHIGFARIVGTLQKEWLEEALRKNRSGDAGSLVVPENLREIQKLFRGKVEDYNPRNGAITLFYDFENPAQAEDWETNEVTGVKDGRLTRLVPPLKGKIAAEHRASFAENIEIEFEAPDDYWSEGGMAKVAYKQTPDAANWSVVQLFPSSGTDKQPGVKLGHSGMFPDFAPHPVQRGKWHKYRLRLHDSVSLWVDEKPLFSSWTAERKGTSLYSSKRAVLRLSFSSGGAGTPYLGFDHVRIKGFLQKEWLEENMKKGGGAFRPAGAQVPPAIQELFRGHVEDFDPQSGRITLAYDFQKPEQKLDWINVRYHPKIPSRTLDVDFHDDLEFSIVESLPPNNLPNDGVIGVAYQNKAENWDCVFVGITRAGKAFTANLLRQTFYFDHAPCAADDNGPRRHTVRATDKQPTTYLVDGTEVLRDSLRSNVSVLSTTLVRPLLQIDAPLSARIVGTLKKEWLNEKLKKPRSDAGRLNSQSPSPEGKVSPEIQKRFQGKVQFFDMETRQATVSYDFADAAQLQDFLVPHPKYQGGRLTLLCESESGAWPLRTDIFRRFSVSLRLEFQLEKPFENRQFLAVRFGGAEQPSAVCFIANRHGAAFEFQVPEKNKRRTLAEVKTDWPTKGSLQVALHEGFFSATLNGKPLLRHPAPNEKRAPLLSVGGGGGCRYVVERLEVNAVVKNKFLGNAIAASQKHDDDD